MDKMKCRSLLMPKITVEISCFVTEDSPYQKAGSKLKARFGIESMHGMQDAKDNRRDNGN